MAASLLRRDKRATAAHLKADLTRSDNSSGLRQLQDLLDAVLNPEKPAADTEALDWCKCLIAGGEGFEEFCKTVRSYDNATLCGLVWTANFVAYRCRTCGISPCMSLCAECFNNGDHTGHDFNMFRSQAGGACDCGDSNVMRDSGWVLAAHANGLAGIVLTGVAVKVSQPSWSNLSIRAFRVAVLCCYVGDFMNYCQSVVSKLPRLGR